MESEYTTNGLPEHFELFMRLSALPQKMVLLHGMANMPDFILHDLSHQAFFNLKKVAYFVDNPDFNCCKGVTGFHEEGECGHNVWQDPDNFNQYMRSLEFNQKVRQVSLPSLYATNRIDSVVQELSHELEIEQARVYSFPLKYGNHGILLIESKNALPSHDFLSQGASLLAFCPVV